MKKKFLLLLIALLLAIAQGFAESISPETNPQTVQFTTAVKQLTTRSVLFTFSVFNPGIVAQEGATDGENMFLNAHDGSAQREDEEYTVSIEGVDSRMFSARITEENNLLGSKSCTLLISYLPTTDGPHYATLKVRRFGSSSSEKTVTLSGVTSEEYRDPLSTQTTGLLPSGEDELTIVDNGLPIWTDTSRPDTVIEVSDSSLDFGSAIIGATVKRTFTVKGYNLTGPLTLNVVTTRSGSSDGFSIDKTRITTSQAARGVTVTVTYHPLYAGVQNSTRVSISGGGAESVSVSLHGTGIGCIPVTVEPSSLSFSDVVIGESETKEFTVSLPDTNLVGVLMLKPVLKDETGMFSVTPSSITADQAANGATVKVTYAPITAGSHNAEVVFSCNNVESQPVNVSGTAVRDFATVLVTTSDGVTMEYLIDENSNIKIEKPNLVIRSYDRVLTYDLNNMTQLAYGQRVVSNEPGQEMLKAGTIILHDLNDNALIQVTDSNGRVVMKRQGNADGNVMISLDDEPSGEYVISTQSQTIKIVKQ